MAIRTKKYKIVDSVFDSTVRAVKITEKNLTDLVAYICRNGGIATGHNGRPEFDRPARIRIKQMNHGANWSKLDWRRAGLGDYIVRFENGSFARVKAADFNRQYVEA